MRRLRKTFKNLFGIRKRDKMGDIRTAVSTPSPVITSLLNDPMRQETERLGSFKCKVPILSETEKTLATSGFFYKDAIKKVQCFACGTRFDFPLNFALRSLEEEHRKTSSHCEFLKSQNKAGNIPVVNRQQSDRTVTSASVNNRSNSESGAPETRMQDNRSEIIGDNGNSPSSQSLSLTSPLDPALMQSYSAQTRNEVRNLYSRAAVDYNLLKSEFERLKTFMSVPAWPIDFIQPVDCARAGFYFVGEGDKVQCSFCRGVAGEWEEGDVPLIEHRRHFPRCPFICGLPVGNIPLGQENDNDEEQPAVPRGVDVCGPYSPESMGLRLTPQGGNLVQGAQPFSGSMQDVATNLKIKPFLGPSNSQMITLQARLKTFKNWPQSVGQDVQVMAEAGFYFTGTSDQVKCFYCSGGLKNWVASDDPWTEHAKWFPFCTHVILNKGDDFIKSVESQPASSPSQLSGNSSDEEEVSSAVEAMEIEKPGSSAASSSGVESSSSAAGSDRGSSPMSDVPSSSGHSSGDEETEVQTAAPSTLSSTKTVKAPKDTDEHRQLMCKICMDNDVGVVFLPCGHLVSCTTCATAFPNCALCRQPIRGVVRAYLS